MAKYEVKVWIGGGYAKATTNCWNKQAVERIARRSGEHVIVNVEANGKIDALCVADEIVGGGLKDLVVPVEVTKV